jgi:cell division septation protein DedD
MENFDDRGQNRIKEKNVYLMHLDTPRILIIVSVIIGLIIGSFLFGMNMNRKTGESNDIASLKDPFSDSSVPENRKDNLPDNKLGALQSDSDPEMNHPEGYVAPKKDDKGLSGNGKNRPANSGTKEGHDVDVINNENVKQIIPASKEASQDNESEKPVKKAKKKGLDKKTQKKDKGKKVVEVSSKSDSKTASKDGKKRFSIQIASLDSKSKAAKEISSLKKMSYDAYIDKTSVNGKSYFRVRIGPIQNKKKAIKILNELQEQNKYPECYMTKD